MTAARITHIVTDLEIGGAEIMLTNLLSAMDRELFEPEVIALSDRGPLALRIEAMDIPVRTLGMKRGSARLSDLMRLARWLRQSRPMFIQTWMYHANLAGGLAAKVAVGVPVVWGIHASHLERKTTRWRTRKMIELSARLSRWLPERIVYCSESSHILHESLGYAEDKMSIIPNGFDIETFVPDPAARTRLRAELGLAEETPLVGMVARFDPQKDHENFLQAAARLRAELPETRFVMCGAGVTEDNAVLMAWAGKYGVRDYCHALGSRKDTAQLLAGLDVASTASSYGEAFPMVVGEAMACGVPCVVTDIGDSSMIVGDTGRSVPPHDPRALAGAWAEILRLGAEKRARLSFAARKRIADHYSLDRITRLYEDLYRTVLP